MGKLVLVLGMLAACGTQDTVSDMCHRAQECNGLRAGVSVQDCIDDRHRCIDQLTSSQRNDWERMMDSCLENDSCSLFGACYDQVPWC